eukprot:6193099-Pleurochrysis_carterae.AAC.3
MLQPSLSCDCVKCRQAAPLSTWLARLSDLDDFFSSMPLVHARAQAFWRDAHHPSQAVHRELMLRAHAMLTDDDTPRP